MARARSGGRWPATKCFRSLLALGVAALVLVLHAPGTQDANADGDTRSLRLFHTHTRESATITFRRSGRYDEAGLQQLNWFLRDWRTNEPTRMDPQLFDVVWAVYREVGADVPIHIISAYRSPETNGMLHRRSQAVAERSQHMLGKAMDISLPGIDMGRVRAAGMRLQYGGVGFYGSNGFVHLDFAGVRAWPRMTRSQLARLFPDGKTVHLPSDGKPLARYEEAKAEILARRGNVAGATSVVAGHEVGVSRRSIWATLVDGSEDWSPDSSQAAFFAPAVARAKGDPAGAGVVLSSDQRAQGGVLPEEPGGVGSSIVSDVKVLLRALFASARVAEPASPARTVRISMSTSKPADVEASAVAITLGPQLNLRLSESPSFGLSSASFSGPAVKPLKFLVAQGS
jgi:uncharacterized protein YcbK (DUF882 family)